MVTKLRHSRRALVVCVVLAMVMGCATTPVGKAYDVVTIARATLNTTMTYLGDEYKAGRLSEEGKATAIMYGGRVQTAIRTASAALATYTKLVESGKETADDGAVMRIALDALADAQTILTKYLEVAVTGGGDTVAD